MYDITMKRGSRCFFKGRESDFERAIDDDDDDNDDFFLHGDGFSSMIITVFLSLQSKIAVTAGKKGLHELVTCRRLVAGHTNFKARVRTFQRSPMYPRTITMM